MPCVYGAIKITLNVLAIPIRTCDSLPNMRQPSPGVSMSSSLVFMIQVTELSMGELLMHSAVSWLNPFLSLGKARKDLELTVFG